MCILDVFIPLVWKKLSHGSKKPKISKLTSAWNNNVLCCLALRFLLSFLALARNWSPSTFIVWSRDSAKVLSLGFTGESQPYRFRMDKMCIFEVKWSFSLTACECAAFFQTKGTGNVCLISLSFSAWFPPQFCRPAFLPFSPSPSRFMAFHSVKSALKTGHPEDLSSI